MNKEDVVQFQTLCNSPVRSEEREKALRRWDSYKLSRQREHWPFRKKVAKPGSQLRRRNGKEWIRDDSSTLRTEPAIDLQGAEFTNVCVGFVDLRGANLDKVRFSGKKQLSALKGARLENASLRSACLAGLQLMQADFSRADLSDANLVSADLSDTNLSGADLRGADLSHANLERANLNGANIDGCILDGAHVFGIAAWDICGNPKSSRDLVVTSSEPHLTADDIKVAQFIYLLVNNPEIRDVLDTVTRKVVLILGAFETERKKVLDALRDELRTRNLVPVMLDFDNTQNRDNTETVTLLARMAKFVIADLTDPKSLPHELSEFVKEVEVPVRLILQEGHETYGMYVDLLKYQWVIEPYVYANKDSLLSNLDEKVISPSEATLQQIESRRTLRSEQN